MYPLFYSAYVCDLHYLRFCVASTVLRSKPQCLSITMSFTGRGELRSVKHLVGLPPLLCVWLSGVQGGHLWLVGPLGVHSFVQVHQHHVLRHGLAAEVTLHVAMRACNTHTHTQVYNRCFDMSWEIGFQLPSTSPCRCVRLQCIHRYTVLYRYINMAWKIRLILKGCSMWPRVPATHTQVYSLIRQSDCMKTSSKRMQTAVSPVHQVWPKPFCKAQ